MPREAGLRMALSTLKSRSDFLAVRGGQRASVPVCLIEAKLRNPARALVKEARFGFTVTKKLGNAVRRNRIRRRLKAAIASAGVEFAREGYDYVVVARPAAFDRHFADMQADIRRAFALLNKTNEPHRDGAREQRLDKPPERVKKPTKRGPA